MKFIAFFLCGCIAVCSAFSQNAEQYFVAGKKAFDEGNYAFAAKNLKALVETYPDDPRADDAEYLLGLTSFYQKDFKTVISLFARFEKKYPKSSYVRRISYWIGAAHYSLNQFDDAIRYFEKQIGFKEEAYFYNRSLFYAAAAYEKQKKYEQAIEAYKRVVSLSDERDFAAQSMFRMGTIRVTLGRYREALLDFSKLLLEFPASVHARDALYFSGMCSVNLGNFEEAEKTFLRLLSYYPDTSYKEGTYYYLARVSRELNKPDAAVKYLELLVREYAKGEYGSDAYKMLAEEYSKMKNTAQAKAAYMKLLGYPIGEAEKQKVNYNLAQLSLSDQDQNAAAEFLKVASMGPDKGIREISLYQRGRILFEGPEKEEAARSLMALCDEFPKSQYFEDAARQLVLYFRSVGEKTRLGLYADKLIASFPQSEFIQDYLFIRGELKLDRRELIGALEDFTRIMDKYPNSKYYDEAAYRIGYVYSLREEYIRAEAYFAGIISRVKSGELREKALLAQGLCFSNAGYPYKAIDSFTTLVSESPSGAWTGKAQYYLGQAYAKAEQFTASAESYGKAAALLAKTPEGEDALYWMAWGYFRAGRYADARKGFLSLADSYPGSKRAGEAVFRAGLSAFTAGNIEESIALYDRALGMLAPQETEEVLYRKAMSCIALGKRDVAVGLLDELAKRFPKSELAAEGTYKLAEDYYVKGSYKDARDYFLSVRRKYPQAKAAEAATFWEADSLFRIGRLQDAGEVLISYLSSYPEKERAYDAAVLLGKILGGLQEKGFVERTFGKVAEFVLPDPVRAPFLLAYARRFLDTDPQKAFDAAKAVADRNAYTDDKNEAFLLVGMALEAMKDYAKARNAYEAVVSRDKEKRGAQALLRIAFCLYESGEREQAAREFMNVSYIFPAYAEFSALGLYKAFEVFLFLGKQDEAEAARKRLQELYPDTSYALELKK